MLSHLATDGSDGSHHTNPRLNRAGLGSHLVGRLREQGIHVWQNRRERARCAISFAALTQAIAGLPVVRRPVGVPVRCHQDCTPWLNMMNTIARRCHDIINFSEIPSAVWDRIDKNRAKLNLRKQDTRHMGSWVWDGVAGRPEGPRFASNLLGPALVYPMPAEHMLPPTEHTLPPTGHRMPPTGQFSQPFRQTVLLTADLARATGQYGQPGGWAPQSAE
jgi:hypothetical protein